jgi:5-methylcytosine-specific restriction endonuclease McrA
VGALLVKALEAARRSSISGAAKRRRTLTRPRWSHPPWSSSRPTRSPCSPRRHSTTASIPARRASATRWSCTSTPLLADPDQVGRSVLEDGARVPAGTSQRLACDASRVVMRHDADGRLIEIGTRTRTIPPALRRALHHRDRGCRFPGCGVRVAQGHHLRHWAQGGPTTLSNLALLCRRHHRAVHEKGNHVERLPDGQLQFRRPTGWVIPDVPLPPHLPDDPAGAIRARNAGSGLDLHARTAMPGGRGEHLDVGYAIDVLHPRARETWD